MKLGLFLFLIGIYGFILNKKNLLLMIISLELMLLAVTLLVRRFTLNIEEILDFTHFPCMCPETKLGLGESPRLNIASW